VNTGTFLKLYPVFTRVDYQKRYSSARIVTGTIFTKSGSVSFVSTVPIYFYLQVSFCSGSFTNKMFFMLALLGEISMLKLEKIFNHLFLLPVKGIPVVSRDGVSTEATDV
jgi:hypothetical protein